MQAAGQGNSSAIRTELQRGEDVNAAGETGWTALMIAAATSESTTAVQLLQAGARVEQKDRYRNTALMAAAAVRFSNLHAAAETTRVLLAHGASVDAENDLGETALMWAARRESRGYPGAASGRQIRYARIPLDTTRCTT
ncbi:MAG: Ankyrin [Bryobacterales bacterium]|nr:Ankyrin [Bryobacterales bacterium]